MSNVSAIIVADSPNLLLYHLPANALLCRMPGCPISV